MPCSAQKPTRIPKISSRPISQRNNYEGRRGSFSITTAGSPMPTSTSAKRDSTMGSRIPKLPPLTPTNTHTSIGSRPKSSADTSLPKVVTVVPPPTLGHKKFDLTSSRDKPLPSAPVAQIFDPNSPLKAHRTLVDAEAGSPSDEQWPCLRPEAASSVKTPPTTNDMSVQHEQQQRSVSDGHKPEQKANTLEENWQSTSSFSFDLHPERTVSPGIQEVTTPPQNEPLPQRDEMRRLSSNNPYAKVIHAMSPNADVAISSPLSHRTSAPMLLSVPPRTSSKRSSMPLYTHSATKEPVRATSALSQPIRSSKTSWPLPEPRIEIPLPTRSYKPSEEQLSSTAVYRPHLVHTHDNAESEKDHEPSVVQNATQHEDCLVNIEDPQPAEKIWVTDSKSGWRSRILSWRPDEPTIGPELRIHPDAHIILLGDIQDLPECSDLRDQSPERASLSRSLNTVTGRMSRHTSPSVNSPTQSHTTTELDTAKSKRIPAIISPIRAMRPSRQSSTAVSPSSPSMPSPPLSRLQADHTELLGNDSAVANAASDTNTTETIAVVKVSMSDDASSMQPSEPDQEKHAPEGTPAKKARNILGLREATPRHPPGERKAANWTAPAITSLQSRTNVVRDPVEQPRSAVEAEEKKPVSFRLRAKRSLRSLFSKRNVEIAQSELQNLEVLLQRQTRVKLIESIFEKLEKMPKDSPNQDRCCKLVETLVSMEEARRDLQRMLEDGEGRLFDGETMQVILGLI